MRNLNTAMELLEPRTLMSAVPLAPTTVHHAPAAGQSTFVHLRTDVPPAPQPVTPVTPAAPTHLAATTATTPTLRIHFDTVSTVAPTVTPKVPTTPATHVATHPATHHATTAGSGQFHVRLASVPHAGNVKPKHKTTKSHSVGAAGPTHFAVKPATPVKTFPVAPTPTPKFVDPATTDASITYKSFAGDPLFAPAGPTITDVTQGYIGDCYLMSTLSSIAKTDPALIERDVVANSNGTFTVKFAGKPETVNADLPVFPDGRVAYAQLGADESLWVAVTEKAYAIYASGKTASYNSISGGWMGSVFAALGIKSSATFAEASSKSLALSIAADLKANDFVTFGTTATVSATSPFVASHAYEVDSVTAANGVVTLITLRNPWGSDVADDGFITVTPQQAMAVFGGMVIAHA